MQDQPTTVQDASHTSVETLPELTPIVPHARRRTVEAYQPAQEVYRSRQRAAWRPVVGSAWARRGLWLGLPAILLCFGFTLLLAQDEPTRTDGWLGIVEAGILAVIAWGGQPLPIPFAQPSSLWPLKRPCRERVLCLVGVGLAILSTWLANQQFLAHQTEMFGAAGWLWLAGMFLLVVSASLWPVSGHKRAWPLGKRAEEARTVAWPTSLSGIEKTNTPLVVSAEPQVQVWAPAELAVSTLPGAEQLRWHTWEILLFIGIVAFAVAARLWDLTNFPFTIHPDEVLTAGNAAAFQDGGQTSIFTTVWYGIDLPGLWFMGVQRSLEIGGFTLFSLRLPAALFGAAAAVPLYFLVRSVWGRTAAITAAAVMSFGTANVNFSRVTLNNIVTPFFWATCFFFLLRALRRGRPVDWVLAGIFGGLSEHFYYGTRLLPFIFISFALYLLVIHWRKTKYYLLSFLLVAMGYMAAMGPLFSWFTHNPRLYFGRGGGVLTWNRIPTSLEDLNAMWNTLWPLFSRNLLTISTAKATDPLYFAPAMLPLEGALLALGVGLLIWRWRQPASFLLLSSGLGVLIVGGTLVPEPGNINHWTPAFPALYAAVALPVSGLAWAAGRFLSRRFQYGGAALLAVALVALGWTDLHFYFNDYYSYRPEFDVPAAKARFQAELGTDYRVRSVGRTWQGYDAGTTSLLVKGVDGGQIWNPAAELPLPLVPGKGLAFVFFADQIQYLPIIQAMYPGGAHGQWIARSGTLLFDHYVVPPEAVASAYGATVQLMDPSSNVPRQAGKVPAIGSVPAGTTYPVRGVWTALLYRPNLSGFALSVQGANASILFDGQASLPRTDSAVQPGWHQVSMEATLSSPTRVKLMVTESGGGPTEVDRASLWPVQAGSGLLGAALRFDTGGTGTSVIRNEQHIGFTDLVRGPTGPEVGVSPPLRARWAGEINAAITGNYQLEIRTNGDARLSVDGKAVVAGCPNGDPTSSAVAVHLTQGWHPIQLDYMTYGNANTLELYWTTPDGVRSLVPPSALRFAPGTAHGPTAPPQAPTAVDCTAPQHPLE